MKCEQSNYYVNYSNVYIITDHCLSLVLNNFCFQIVKNTQVWRLVAAQETVMSNMV